MARSTLVRRPAPMVAFDDGTDETLLMGADWPLLRSLSEEDRRQVLSAARRRRFTRRVNVQLMEALFVPVDRRVVRRLLSLADIYAQRDQIDGVEVALTQDDLASLAGTSRATVNRVLRQAEEAGAVSLSRGRIRVTDRALLAKRAR